MAFDQTTRNRLQKFVSDARALLSEEFIRQMQNDFGLDPASGEVSSLGKLTHLNDSQRETAQLLRDTMQHYMASGSVDAPAALDRVVREQAFTVLNRLCALRMAEARGILIESVGNGYTSKGFQLYAHLAGTGLGETGDSYRCYLFSIFDEFSQDLAVLFDRYSPMGRLFPRDSVLLELLEQINHTDIAPLWAEDESIGWIYQYFNSKEERKKMRDESSAPRNSRELAVRNQFFTPRYVVEFLTDNTLGRIWYEMTQGQTGLKDSCTYLVRRPNEIFLQPGDKAPKQDESSEDLSQEDLLKQLVYIPFRPIKDPREIRMLDPACGSMHFGLYAFDLFFTIYEEAWEMEEKGQWPLAENLSNSHTLHDSYESQKKLLQDIPRLIIEHNIHGVDIDPRAVQIAGLSLWLRAQRSWQDQGVKLIDRPQIRKSNIVCAEPMPGEKDLLQDFANSLKPSVLGQLVEIIFEKMELAGEAGSLLKIEEEIVDAIEETREEFNKELLRRKHSEGFLPGMAPGKQQASLFDFADLPRETKFWQTAEQQILDALQDYAEHAEGSESTRRRLFAEDAARGFAFIDLCRKRFDVVLMNPPFGKGSLNTTAYLNTVYPSSKLDIYATFVERGVELGRGGFTGAITSRTGFFLSSLSDWRKRLLTLATFETVLDLGNDVLDAAMVSTASYTLRNQKLSMKCSVIPMLDISPDKREKYFDSALTLTDNGRRHFPVNFDKFNTIQGSPFCYWLQPSAINHLEHSPVFKGEGRDVRVGLQTGDNFRFLRLFWEVPQDKLGSNWISYAKGGDYSPFYRDIELVIDWKNNGAVVKQLATELYGSETRTIKSQDKYFKRGLTFTIYTVKGFNIRPLPEGCIFDVAGSSVFLDSADNDDFFYTLGFMSSPVFQYFISAISDDRKWQVGLLQMVPWLTPDAATKLNVSENCKNACDISRKLRKYEETDKAFQGFPRENIDIQEIHESFCLEVEISKKKISNLWLDNALKIADLYGLDANKLNRKPVVDYTKLNQYEFDSGFECYSKQEFFKIYISWCFGLVFNRWKSVDLVIREIDFFGKPKCAEVQNNNFIDGEGIIGGDVILNSLESKIMSSVLDFEETVKQFEGSLSYNSLQAYLTNAKGFFDDHLKKYSKSRRQAPIYWPISTASGSFTLWLYYHRLTDQTLYTCVNDFVEPKIEYVGNQLSDLQSKTSRTKQEEKELEKLIDLELELKDFCDEILRIAKFWKPNLNDGVQITAAPLWSCFRLAKWSKKLKTIWQKMEKGDFDWAHLAYSIWPERVIPKAHKDRSLAIAHDLENELWVEVENGTDRQGNPKYKWKPKKLSKADIDDLIRQKTGK